MRTLIEVPLSEFSDAILELSDLNARSLLDLEDAIAVSIDRGDRGNARSLFPA